MDDQRHFTEIVFVGPSTEVFATLCELDLGVPLWRIRTLDERSLSPHGLVLLEVDPAVDLDARCERASACCAGSPTIVVSADLTDEDALAYLSCGAFGALDPGSDRGVLRRQLLGAMRGEPAFRRSVIGRWLRLAREARTSDALGLTPRQREVLALVSRGSSDRDIAAALGISVATARKHVQNLLRRLGVPTRAAAVARMLTARPRGSAQLSR